jgi:hypothetical protein
MNKKILFFLSLLSFSHSEAALLCQDALLPNGPVSRLGQLTSPLVADLLEEYHQRRALAGPTVLRADRLVFNGVGNRDVYNIARPMTVKLQGREQRVLLGRVEPRENHESEVWAFVPISDSELQYVPAAGVPHFKMEDPFFTQIDGELFIGGVETFPRSEKPGDLGYRTAFYRDHGQGAEHLEKFFTGPVGMKDIRFTKLNNGKILVSGRPQNGDPALGGRGKNSQITVDSVEQLSAAVISQAQIIDGQVNEKDWIGTNEIHVLEDGSVGFLSHVAHYTDAGEKNRGYYVAVYTQDNLKPQILLERNDLPGGIQSALERNASKRPDLVNVLFGGGLERLGNGLAYLYIGAGDAEPWRILIRDPFQKTSSRHQ